MEPRINLSIPEDLFAFFASDPIGPILTLGHIADQAMSPVSRKLNLFLEGIPEDAVAAVRVDKEFLWFARRTTDIEREARIWIAQRWLPEEIARRRLQVLRDEARMQRPRPYCVSALADLEVDNEHLVRLSEFEYDGSRLLRNGVAFKILSTQGSPNSTYWLQESLYSTRLADRVKVRLDPFLYGPEADFPAIEYRMTMYGRTLDWDRIGRLREPEHGSWFSESLDTVTEYCWTPRDTEVSFVCEEGPRSDSVVSKAFRYLHAIYLAESSVVKHLDGALRLYHPEEAEARKTQHVRDAGKAGLRTKVFRIDGEMSREHLSLIAQTFFVWNRDVHEYFFAELAVH